MSAIKDPRDVLAALFELASTEHGRNDGPVAFRSRTEAPVYRRTERRQEALGEGLRAANLLTAEELAACRLRYAEGRQAGQGQRARLRPLDAIAAELGLTPRQVESRLTSALRKVRAHIDTARNTVDSDGKQKHA